MSQFSEKIREYLGFIEGPAHLLFMSEAGRCEYLIFIAVHLSLVRTLATQQGLAIDNEVAPEIEELCQCYYEYFCEGSIREGEKRRRENKILLRYLKENLRLKEVSSEQFRQWKKRALEKDPMKELDKILRKVKKEDSGGDKKNG